MRLSPERMTIVGPELGACLAQGPGARTYVVVYTNNHVCPQSYPCKGNRRRLGLRPVPGRKSVMASAMRLLDLPRMHPMLLWEPIIPATCSVFRQRGLEPPF